MCLTNIASFELLGSSNVPRGSVFNHILANCGTTGPLFVQSTSNHHWRTNRESMWAKVMLCHIHFPKKTVKPPLNGVMGWSARSIIFFFPFFLFFYLFIFSLIGLNDCLCAAAVSMWWAEAHVMGCGGQRAVHEDVKVFLSSSNGP